MPYPDPHDTGADSQPDAYKGLPGEGRKGEADSRDQSTRKGKNGPLLDKSEGDSAILARGLYKAQTKSRNKRTARWEVNRLRRAGLTHVRLQRSDQNINQWMVYVPPGAAFLPPTMNKAARLSRKLRQNMLVDPPTPEVTPASDGDEDREAAEFATRVLQDLGSESQTDNLGVFSRSFDLACTYGSGFRYHYIDDFGGGRREQRIWACPTAQTVDQATVDPQTGTKYGGDLVLRYVAQDGKTITDDPKQAALRWMPKLKQRAVSGRNITFLPEGCTGIETAQGIQLAEMLPLGDLKAEFDLKLTDVEVADLKWRPEKYQQLLPTHLPKEQIDTENQDEAKGNPASGAGAQGADMLSDGTLVYCLRTWYAEGSVYPNGCYHVVIGKNLVAQRNTLEYQDPNGGRCVLPIPIDQFGMWQEGEDDPYYYGLMDLLGSGNELRASTFGSMVEHLDRFNRRKVFYPIQSSIQPKHLQNPQGTYIPMSPGGKPEYEVVPDYPHSAVDMLGRVDAEMDDDSGLTPIAQGVNPPNVGSGLHAQQLIEQSNVNLSGIKQNAEKALCRGWRIDLELVRAFYKVEQQIGWTDDDGEYKQKSFVGTDLGSCKQVRIQRGSFTLLSPSAKAALAQAMQQIGVLTIDELKRVTWGNVGGILGLQDNPHLLRIRRQISEWLEGPPEGAPPDNWPTLLSGIWGPRLSDGLPGVASIRFTELARLVSGSRYAKQPPMWRAAVDSEFQKMKTAAGIQTVADQQAASQNQPDPALEAVLESVNYTAAPDPIRQQMEQKLGFAPRPPEPSPSDVKLETARMAGNAAVNREQMKQQGATELQSAKHGHEDSAAATNHARAVELQGQSDTAALANTAAKAQATQAAKQQAQAAAVSGAPAPSAVP